MSNTYQQQLTAFACGLAEFYDANTHGEDWWSAYTVDYTTYDVNIHINDGCLCIDAYVVRDGDIDTSSGFNLYNRRLTKRERKDWGVRTDAEISRDYHGVEAR